MKSAAALAVVVSSLLLPSAHAATNASAPARFGFGGPEIFPVDFQIAHLHAADFDGDGLKDLLVVNNARSKITLLYNRTGKPPEPKAAAFGGTTTVIEFISQDLEPLRANVDAWHQKADPKAAVDFGFHMNSTFNFFSE